MQVNRAIALATFLFQGLQAQTAAEPEALLPSVLDIYDLEVADKVTIEVTAKLLKRE